MQTALLLTWTLELASPGTLAVEYTVENPGTESVWLLDLPLVFAEKSGVEADPSAVQVRGGEADTARLVRGYLRPSGHSQIELIPALRELPAGGSVTGSGSLSLPLQTWHPNEISRNPISARTAILEVGYLESVDAVHTQSLVDGTEVRVPSRKAAVEQKIVRGEPLALPE